MDRRDFFRSGVSKAGQAAVQLADASAVRAASRWVRPPYAVDELEFLLACTRCGDCIEACPHQVIFALGTRLGARVAGTPAMDLLSKGCHLCADWPCVSSCEPNALQLPVVAEGESLLPPRIAKAWIDIDTCLPYSGPECGACADSCPVAGALTWADEKPAIDTAHCTGCGLCREACILEPKAIGIASVYRESDIELDGAINEA